MMMVMMMTTTMMIMMMMMMMTTTMMMTMTTMMTMMMMSMMMSLMMMIRVGPVLKTGCPPLHSEQFFGNDVFSKHLFPMVSYTQNTHKIPIPSNPRSTLLPSPLPRPLQPV